MDLNSEDDSRTGSARGDSEGGGTISKMNNPGESASLASTLSTLAPVLIYTSVCLIIFWILRRILTRVYSPRASLRHYFAEERTSSPLKGWFDWVKPFIKEDDVHVLNHSSLDAYLFLRYLKVLSLICFVGVCLTWPILMPIHATGSGGQSELDSITIGNIENKNLLFVHVAIAWIFFGFILFTIYRECIYYINLRHAYLFSPYYSKRLSSRTVLFQCVPHKYLDAQRLRKVYGDSVKHVWILRDTTDLEHLVQEREDTARRLERCEIRLIKAADAARRKGLRSAPSQPFHSLPLRRNGELPKDGAPVPANPTEITVRGNSTDSTTASASSTSITSASPVTSPSAATTEDPEKHIGLDSPPPDVNGSIAAQWVPASHRPGHRPLGNFFRRVDTIKWTRNRLKLLAPQIAKMRRKLHAGDEGRLLGSVFVEFQTQSDAQRAYQVLANDRPMHMSPRFIGVRPDEIVWHSLRLTWFARMVRRVAMMALIIAAIVFWALPSAFVGLMTNVSYLAETFVFLRWLELLPKAVIGVIQGFVPALALSLLMAIVPWLLRGCARLAGEPSLSEIELYVQSFYFGFQVIQVFLVTTMTSAASAAIEGVLQKPFSAPEVLSSNLPKASNFYLSYILIQCLAVGATGLLHLWDVIKHGVMTRFIQSPRAKWRIYKFIRPIHWGAWFPVFTNLGVIAICYACIAPLILGFASAGLYIIYVLNKYNFIFVEDSSIDTRGLVYPRALKQLLFGLYVAEICLIGLFGLQGAFAPMVLMVVCLVFSVIFHVMLSDALSPLLANLPLTMAYEHEELMGEHKEDDSLPAFNIDPASVPLPPDSEEESDEDDDGPVHETTGNRGLPRSMGIEGSLSLSKIVRKWSWDLYVRQVTDALHKIGLGPVLARVDAIVHPAYSETPNPIMRFLHPMTFDSFTHLRRMIPDDLPDPTATYPEDYIFKAYYPPEMWTPPPKLWLPRDEAGVSAQEVEHCKRFGRVVASDDGAWLDEHGRVHCDVQKAPFWEDRALY